MPSLEVFESLKVWEDICRILHPFGQLNSEYLEGAEHVEAVWLHKVEYNIKVLKVHLRESGCGSCCDCSHEWFKEAAKITVLVQPDGIEVLQRWHNRKCLTFFGL